jgi:hypothetical protein
MVRQNWQRPQRSRAYARQQGSGYSTETNRELLRRRAAEAKGDVAYNRAVLRQALGQAERWGLVTRNVAKLVEPPRVPRRARSQNLSWDGASAFVTKRPWRTSGGGRGRGRSR